MKYKLLIFDLDGTLAEPPPDAKSPPFRSSGEAYVWRPSAREALEVLHMQGIEIAIATNQGGIGQGHLDYGETRQAIHTLLSTLSFPVPWLMSPYIFRFENEGENIWRPFASWRKPSPVMLLMLAMQFPHIPLTEVLCIGDRTEDSMAARNAGFDYQDEFEFFHPVDKPASGEPDEALPF